MSTTPSTDGTATLDPIETEFTLQTPFPIPGDEQFEGEDFINGQGLRMLAGELLAAHERFAYIRRARIEYLWKRKGGMQGGKVLFSQTMRTPPLARHYSNKEFVIYFAADNCREAGLSELQVRAMMYHALRHLRYDGEKGEIKIQGHEFEGFGDEVAEFGWWQTDLERMAKAVQLRLGFELPNPDEAADGTGHVATLFDHAAAEAEGDDHHEADDETE